jgi:hypothetical protein
MLVPKAIVKRVHVLDKLQEHHEYLSIRQSDLGSKRYAWSNRLDQLAFFDNHSSAVKALQSLNPVKDNIYFIETIYIYE